MSDETLPAGDAPSSPVTFMTNEVTAAKPKGGRPKKSETVGDDASGGAAKGPYPWGAKEPLKRIADLERSLSLCEAKRKAESEAWAVRLAQLEGEERQIKADLKTARTIAEKVRRESAARSVAATLERLLAAGKIDASALDGGVDLEAVLLSALGKKA